MSKKAPVNAKQKIILNFVSEENPRSSSYILKILYGQNTLKNDHRFVVDALFALEKAGLIRRAKDAPPLEWLRTPAGSEFMGFRQAVAA